MRAHVHLPAELVAEVDELVGTGTRGRFIREAIGERVRRERLLQAYDAVLGSLKDEHIPEWDTPESSATWVLDLRVESDRIRGAEIKLEDDIVVRSPRT